MNNTNTYELAFLALASLSDKEVADVQSTLSDAIASAGGQVVSLGDVHYIRLAYEMTKKVGSKNVRHNEAYFSWMKLSITTDAIAELDAAARSHDDILRYMIVSTESDDSLTNVFSLEQEEEVSAEEVEEVAVETETRAEETEEKAVSGDTVTPEDLTKIEGIGPEIATTLVNGGIATYAQLADASVEDVQAMIEGVRGSHDAGTWAQQAALARDGQWDELETLQAELDGGKEA